MKRIKMIAIATFTILYAASLALSAAASDTPSGPASRADRGKYLVTAMGCNDCHTPWKVGPNGPEPDMTRMLSGHPQSLQMPAAPVVNGPWLMVGAATNTAFAGPWGVSYAANLTPDTHTGLGIWTEDIFVKAIRTGKHFGTSRPIQPPMPWFAFRNLNDEDLKSIYAYLRVIPPVKNLVPDYAPPKEPAQKLASAARPERSGK